MSIRRATFVLRLWREPGAPSGHWQGEVEHLQAGHAARAADEKALFEFIRSELAEMENSAANPDLPSGMALPSS